MVLTIPVLFGILAEKQLPPLLCLGLYACSSTYQLIYKQSRYIFTLQQTLKRHKNTSTNTWRSEIYQYQIGSVVVLLKNRLLRPPQRSPNLIPAFCEKEEDTKTTRFFKR